MQRRVDSTPTRLVAGLLGRAGNPSLPRHLILFTFILRASSFCTLVVVRIRNALPAFNVLQLEGQLEPDCHFASSIVPCSEEQSKSLGLSLYECSMNYGTLNAILGP